MSEFPENSNKKNNQFSSKNKETSKNNSKNNNNVNINNINTINNNNKSINNNIISNSPKNNFSFSKNSIISNSKSKLDKDIESIYQVIFKLNEEISYTFDVDEYITFHSLKCILSHALRIPKNSFQIFHIQTNKEYTNYENETLDYLFPNIKKIYFKLNIDYNKLYINEDFNIKLEQTECLLHNKFQTFYCFDCKKSICYDCLQKNHLSHKYVEKYNILAPANIIINDIFKDKKNYLCDKKYDKTYKSQDLKLKIKNIYFNELHNQLNKIQEKLYKIIDNFCDCVIYTEKNVNKNIDLLQIYSQEAFIALKNDINTKNIISDNEIFLTLDNKINEIKNSKKILENFKTKYVNINNNYIDIQDLVNNTYLEIYQFLSKFIDGNNEYNNLINKIKDCVVNEINREYVFKNMFNEINVERKSMSKNSINRKSFINEIVNGNNNIDIENINEDNNIDNYLQKIQSKTNIKMKNTIKILI